jgi:type IV pilus assembly protein PilC
MAATMSKFRYEAETLEGQAVKGVVLAPSASAARNQLAVQGIRVTKLTERKGLQMEVTKQRVPLVDIMHFSRQMSTFMRSGVPVVEALDNLRSDTKNKRFQQVLADIIERVGSGRSVSEAIGHHAEVFPPYFLALLNAAEYTGRIDEAFEQLHKYVKRDIELQRQVRKALIYPLILMGVAILVTALIVVFVIPRFADFYKDFKGKDGKPAQLPLPTRMLISIADFVQSPYGIITGIALVGLVIGGVLWVRTPNGRKALHSSLLNLPLVGKVTTYSSTERFTRVLSVLLDAGVALPDALPTAIDCSNNVVFKERLSEAGEEVLTGQGFTEPIRKTDLFPSAVVQMVRVGERTGELSDQLNNAATFYEDEVSYAVEKLTSWFEPMVLIFIGVVVGFVALAMVSAMYGIYNQVSV